MSTTGSTFADTQELLREMVAEAQALQHAAGGSVTDTVAGWLASQYLVAAREKLTATNATSRFEVLRTFLHDWTLLRRGDHAAARLQLDREELDWQRANRQAQKEREFREWIKRPEIRKQYFPKPRGGISPETLKKIEAELHLL
ncbi:MAG: hypothetical protein IH623_19720 [Verrucomicrobia bacterium]|nr:hypothetical protein [Verrucomicrobiota bacterium]